MSLSFPFHVYTSNLLSQNQSTPTTTTATSTASSISVSLSAASDYCSAVQAEAQKIKRITKTLGWSKKYARNATKNAKKVQGGGEGASADEEVGEEGVESSATLRFGPDRAWSLDQILSGEAFADAPMVEAAMRLGDRVRPGASAGTAARSVYDRTPVRADEPDDLEDPAARAARLAVRDAALDRAYAECRRRVFELCVLEVERSSAKVSRALLEAKAAASADPPASRARKDRLAAVGRTARRRLDKQAGVLEAAAAGLTDAQTCAEVSAYLQALRGSVAMARSEFATAHALFVGASEVYAKLLEAAKMTGDASVAVLEKKAKAVAVSIRYCTYNLKAEGVDVAALRQALADGGNDALGGEVLQAKLADLMSTALAEQAEAFATVEWRGETVHVRDRRVREALATAKEAHSTGTAESLDEAAAAYSTATTLVDRSVDADVRLAAYIKTHRAAVTLARARLLLTSHRRAMVLKWQQGRRVKGDEVLRTLDVLEAAYSDLAHVGTKAEAGAAIADAASCRAARAHAVSLTLASRDAIAEAAAVAQRGIALGKVSLKSRAATGGRNSPLPETWEPVIDLEEVVQECGAVAAQMQARDALRATQEQEATATSLGDASGRKGRGDAQVPLELRQTLPTFDAQVVAERALANFPPSYEPAFAPLEPDVLIPPLMDFPDLSEHLAPGHGGGGGGGAAGGAGGSGTGGGGGGSSSG
eukprot:CAMPEP_0170745212 /NCGR_PEP_ID=MMETSP0437-20130122/8179_1 /TAXON_ID=0 /ORGANISM="Sexangularia sp." /LENGTH=707 /DNA_ID=CAMNT_0011083929 /DNA_START=57 /DNA_END=2176 /DNA_ORIENTATION=-